MANPASLPFRYYLGIDQTGSIDPKRKKPRAFHCALAFREKSVWRLESGTLSEFTATSVSNFVSQTTHQKYRPDQLAILIDCVLGLPELFWTSHKVTPQMLWEVYRSTLSSPEWGREAAQVFFSKLWDSCPRVAKAPGLFPKRVCEIQAGASSVFQTYPFQKNIQTGTFRFWKEMTRDESKPWFKQWPFPQNAYGKASIPTVFETYPSLLWQELWGLPTRNRTRLLTAINQTFQKSQLTLRMNDRALLVKNADAADAATSALGGLLLQKQGMLTKNKKCHLGEGWIVGLK